MQAVILADKYSQDTVKGIINSYKKQGVKDFIVCRTSTREMIEECEYEDYKVIEVRVERKNKTGGQLLKIANMLSDDEPFFLTYGDYLCNIDLNNFMKFHKSQGKVLSISIIKERDRQLFGGYMIVDFDAIGYIDNENTVFEKAPLTKIAEDDEIGWYYFSGSYQITYQHMKIYGF